MCTLVCVIVIIFIRQFVHVLFMSKVVVRKWKLICHAIDYRRFIFGDIKDSTNLVVKWKRFNESCFFVLYPISNGSERTNCRNIFFFKFHFKQRYIRRLFSYILL